MITSQIESFRANASTVDFPIYGEVDLHVKDAVVRTQMMVPPEAPMPMRRQPTPQLIAPLRWPVWSMMIQGLANLVRRSRYSLGLERD